MSTVLIPAEISGALTAGYQRLAAWSDVLDRINVFPVPDGDTGRNLVLSLLPLRQESKPRQAVVRSLLLSARGNSGNIISNFLAGFLQDASPALPAACTAGWQRARQAVSSPQPGTMLTVMEALARALNNGLPGDPLQDPEPLLQILEEQVRASAQVLPAMVQAQVVDAGVLGTFLFLEGFLLHLAGRGQAFRSVEGCFPGLLRVNQGYPVDLEVNHCIDTVLELEDGAGVDLARLHGLGQDVVATTVGNCLKLHIHSMDAAQTRRLLGALGQVTAWAQDDLAEQTRRFHQAPPRQALHVMVDAAGSLSPGAAKREGLTLLPNYITLADASLPETYLAPESLYQAMRSGLRVSTAQASLVERHQAYAKSLDLFGRVLYLSVGSAYTGNFQVARDWQQSRELEDEFTVLDTGAASGRLGLMALAVGRRSQQATTAGEVVTFARWAREACQEYIFLDTLRYLAAGGRVPKAKAWLGNLLNLKPVLTTTREGVQKMGVCRDREEQLAWALPRMASSLPPDQPAAILLQYTDNLDWVRESAGARVKAAFPWAQTRVAPLSLTTGVHCGPGTWAVAFIPAQGWEPGG